MPNTRKYLDNVNDELQYESVTLAAAIITALETTPPTTDPEDPTAPSAYHLTEPTLHRATGARLHLTDRYGRWDYQITIIARRKKSAD